MSTTSPNFTFVIATTSDLVNVVTQIANNFTTIDSVLSIAHTGTGQLKNNLSLQTPTLINPTLSGTLAGGNLVTAATGAFQKITATGGTLTASTFAIGTYSYPATVGASADVLTVVTSNAVWVANAPGTGANQNLSNLAAVAVNTNLNTFTAGVVTLTTLNANAITGTAGAVTGLTSFQATTGTFGVNLTVVGTVNAGAVNATGGTITAAGFAIGTYAYPATVGSTYQQLVVTTGNLVFASQMTKTAFAYFFMATNTTINQGTNASLVMTGSLYAGGGVAAANATFTITSSGYYLIAACVNMGALTTPITTGGIRLWINGTAVGWLDRAHGTAPNNIPISANTVISASSGLSFAVSLELTGSGGTFNVNSGSDKSFCTITRLIQL